MGSPLDYQDTVELLNAGEATGPTQGPVSLRLEPVPITIVCNDSTQTHIKAAAESWGWDERGIVVIDGVWSYDQYTAEQMQAEGAKTEDCLIPYTTIHHITYHFDELQEGTNPND